MVVALLHRLERLNVRANAGKIHKNQFQKLSTDVCAEFGRRNSTSLANELEL
jgi:hypothetical protein